MPAKTKMSAREWFHHSVFCTIQRDNTDVEQGFTCELTDSGDYYLIFFLVGLFSYCP